MLKKGDILLHGHTHIPACEQVGEYTYVNPGSVSIPKENSYNSYIIIDDEGIHFKNLDMEEYKFVAKTDL